MTSPDGDIAGFLSGMTRGPATERRAKPFVGVDECFNRQEIGQLTRTLLRRDLIDCSSPLWYETRENAGVVTGTFLGGVDRDSAFRGPNPLISDIGVPAKHRSWSDSRVVQLLVVHFVSYDSVVLLSENTRNDLGGVRRLLNEIVGPSLAGRTDGLSLTALFKKGKTNIEKYCREASTYFECERYDPGYHELLL
jgi:hypothetical protein